VTKRADLHPSRKREYERLVRAAASGDDDAMEQLLMRVQSVAYRFSLLVCGHPQDAEDVMQEALLKTYRHVRRIEEPAAFQTWLFRTVRNFCLMKRRRKVDEPARFESLDGAPGGAGASGGVAPPLDVPDEGRSPADLAVNAWLGRRLRTALGRLAPVDRMIVLLREMEGLSTREVAAITRMSEANVKTRLHRARATLRELLKEA
jgi:RNA polymerase sigma-70 factor (ECF subfamily)